MIWIAPTEEDADTAALEKRLWTAADQFRANSGLKSHGAEARFDYLLNRPEAENIGAKVNAATRDIEKHSPQLAGLLPQTYSLFTSTLLKEVLNALSEIPTTVDYGNLGRILDPDCGSGGMFVSSARLGEEHAASTPSARAANHSSPTGRRNGVQGLAAQYSGDPHRGLSIHGVEQTDETRRRCPLNLAVDGLDTDIRQGGQVNSYHDDSHKATGPVESCIDRSAVSMN